MWEDPANKNGGKWILQCNAKDLTPLWESTVRASSFFPTILLVMRHVCSCWP